MISSLTLALSAFNEIDVRAINVGKQNSEFYHVYYKKDGLNRVMLVPRSIEDFEQLQSEVKILIERSFEQQEKLGNCDTK
jgi:hypothetical protein